MYVYIDKYDYGINNLNNEYIDDEIEIINNKIIEIEGNNFTFFKIFEEILMNERKKIKIDFQNESIYQNRFDNIQNQIFVLQMKQFAESIFNIKKDTKKNRYITSFDYAENIDSLILEENDYRELLLFRDPMNSISIYDLFKEKVHSYYKTTSLTNNNKSSTSKKYQINKNKNNKKYKKLKYVKKKKEIPKLKNKEEIQIAKFCSVNYQFCHHCKQRKPAEVMIKCNSINSPKFTETPFKTYYVNNTTIAKSKKI